MNTASSDNALEILLQNIYVSRRIPLASTITILVSSVVVVVAMIFIEIPVHWWNAYQHQVHTCITINSPA